MTKKQILALYGLALGVITELVVGATFIADSSIQRKLALEPQALALVSTIDLQNAAGIDAEVLPDIDTPTPYSDGEGLIGADNPLAVDPMGYPITSDYGGLDTDIAPTVEEIPTGSEPSDSDSDAPLGQGGPGPFDDDYPAPGSGSDWDSSYPAPVYPTATRAPSATLALTLTNTATSTLAASATSAASATATLPPLVPAVPATATPVTPSPEPTQPDAETAAPTATEAAPTAPPPTEAPAEEIPADLPVLHARSVSAAPQVDGAADEAAWNEAPSLHLNTQGGANASATQVTLRALYEAERVYFLLTWGDPSLSYLRQPWEMQPDGSWRVLSEGADGDENVYFEDQLALAFPLNRSVPQVSLVSSPAPGTDADLWLWRSVSSLGQLDDRRLGEAGLQPDPSDGGGSLLNRAADSALPVYMPPGGGERSGAPGYILDSEKAPFDPALFQPGERLPGVVVAAYTGDRGDFAAAWRYANGVWTLEFSRARATGSAHDVQFSDPALAYPFALATFDNTQARPAEAQSAAVLRFE